ncbi:MAG: SurA N-terminal domain-containing protein [Arenicellaceae bacterium]|nr:SurA N-terminal domain-containing protein [Arenicellaceae bacterium]
MLNVIRSRAAGFGAWIIALIIMIPMALWGINDYVAVDPDPPVAEINGQTLSQAMFRNALDAQRRNIRTQLGATADVSYLDSAEFQRGVLDSMINELVVQDQVEQQGYRLGDKELADLLREQEIFQLDGAFSQEAYDTYLVSQGQFSKQRFEETIRKRSLLRQYTAGYEESSFVLPGEMRRLLSYQAEKRSIAIATFENAVYVDQIEPSEQDLEEYYQANLDSFFEPEKITVEYVRLAVEDYTDDVEVSEEEILAGYEAQQEQLRSGETRSTQHILIAVAEDASVADQEAANSKILDIQDRLAAGVDFGELASEHSDDPGSAANSGDLGFIQKGQMVGPFEEVAYALEVGVVSEPVRTRFGLHLVKVAEINASVVPPLEEVREGILADLQRVEATNRYVEQVENLRNLVFEQPDALDGVAAELGVDTTISDWFSRDAGEGVASNAQLRAIAFAEDVYELAMNSDVIDLGNDVAVAIRLVESEPAAPRPLGEVQDVVKSAVINQAASDLAAASAEQALMELQEAGDWISMTENADYNFEAYNVSRIDTIRIVDNEVLSMVFALDDSGVGGFHQVFLTDGVALVYLNGIEKVSPDTVEVELQDSVRRIIRSRSGQGAVAGVIASARGQSKLIINEDML